LRHGRRFGYGADTYQASIDMAELSLLRRYALRCAPDRRRRHSCRHQIADGTDRAAFMSRACWR